MAVQVKQNEDLQEDEYTEEHPLDDINLNKETETPKPNKSLCGFCINIVRNITVEPCIFLFVVGMMISITAMQNLYLEKACRVNLKFNKTICDAMMSQGLESQNVYERDSQILLASAQTWRTYLSTTLPCLIALFCGSFSDRTGFRKFFLCIPLIGQILACINSMINILFFEQLNLQVLAFTDGLMEGASGGWCLALLASFAFVCAVTNEKTRTFRLGLVNFHMTVAFPVGMGSSGPLLRHLGYKGCFIVAICLHGINLLYTVFLLKDPMKTKEQTEYAGKGTLQLIRTFFDVKNIQDTVKVLYRKAPNNRRMRLCILLAVVCVLFGPMYGEITIMYMSTRYRFNWDEVKFSIFQTYNFITHTVGTVFSILVFSKYLQWHDSLLGIISTVSKIAASFVYAFAPNEKIFFLAPMVEILNGTSLLAMRSILSKLVEPNELGSITSLVSLTENLMPLLYVPLYTQVYASTIEVLPGAVFLVGSLMTVPAVIVLTYLFYEHRKQLRSRRPSIKL